MDTPKEHKLGEAVVAQTLIKHGYTAHRRGDRGFIKYTIRGRYHALYRAGRWYLHYDRADKHGMGRYIEPDRLKGLAIEANRINKHKQSDDNTERKQAEATHAQAIPRPKREERAVLYWMAYAIKNLLARGFKNGGQA